MLRLQRGADRDGVDRTETFERPQCMDLSERLRVITRKLVERRHDGSIVAVDQQLLRRIAPPTVLMAEVRQQLTAGFVLGGNCDRGCPYRDQCVLHGQEVVLSPRDSRGSRCRNGSLNAVGVETGCVSHDE